MQKEPTKLYLSPPPLFLMWIVEVRFLMQSVIQSVEEFHYISPCLKWEMILQNYTTAKKKRPNQLGYLVGIWL